MDQRDGLACPRLAESVALSLPASSQRIRGAQTGRPLIRVGLARATDRPARAPSGLVPSLAGRPSVSARGPITESTYDGARPSRMRCGLRPARSRPPRSRRAVRRRSSSHCAASVAVRLPSPFPVPDSRRSSPGRDGGADTEAATSTPGWDAVWPRLRAEAPMAAPARSGRRHKETATPRGNPSDRPAVVSGVFASMSVLVRLPVRRRLGPGSDDRHGCRWPLGHRGRAPLRRRSGASPRLEPAREGTWPTTGHRRHVDVPFWSRAWTRLQLRRPGALPGRGLASGVTPSWSEQGRCRGRSRVPPVRSKASPRSFP